MVSFIGQLGADTKVSSTPIKMEEAPSIKVMDHGKRESIKMINEKENSS